MDDMSTPNRQLPPELQPRPMSPETPLTCTLTAQEWNVVLAALNELPRRVSDPVFAKLMAQLQQS